MKKILTLILLLLSLTNFSQTVKLIITDEISNEPIPLTDLQIIKTRKYLGTTDFDGAISINLTLIDTSEIRLYNENYIPKNIKLINIKNDTTFSLYPDSLHLFSNKCLEHKIDSTTFQKGQIKSIKTINCYREFYKNGNIKHQRISLTSHSYQKTYWFRNGNLKSIKIYSWGYKKGADEGSWSLKSERKFKKTKTTANNGYKTYGLN